MDTKAAEMASAVPRNSDRTGFTYSPAKGASQSVLEDLPMGRKMLKKLRSREGASLTFALLAFLVCAAVSAVLVAAGMASAGRLSGLAEADQRYYAVTSAAQLFCDAIGESKSYSVECTEIKKTLTDIIYTFNPITGEMTPSGSPVAEPTVYKLRMVPKDAFDEDNKTEGTQTSNPALNSTDPPSALMEAALYYIFGDQISVPENDEANELVQYIYVHKVKPGAGTKKLSKTFQIKESTNNATYLGLTVDVKMDIAPDGSMLLTFSNHLTDEQIAKNEGTYYMQVELGVKAVTTENYSEKEENVTGYPLYKPDEKYYEEKYETFKTTVRTTTITWSVGNVSKVYKSAEAPEGGGT